MGPVRVADHPGGVRLLTLDRPPANAEDESLMRALGDAVSTAREDAAVRAVVLTGEGPFFSGGFDLAAPRRDDATATQLREQFRDVHLGLLTLPKPTVAMAARRMPTLAPLKRTCRIRWGSRSRSSRARARAAP